MTTQRNFPKEKYQRTAKFPFRALQRWLWPDHIDKALSKTLKAWLKETHKEDHEHRESDHLGAQLCWLIAVYPHSPPSILDAFADINAEAFRERIAENPNTTPSTLTRLALSGTAKVRIAVAENHNTTSETLIKLSQDDNADVRFEIAGNAQHPASILLSLTSDENCYVASRAKKTITRLNPPKPDFLPQTEIQNETDRYLGHSKFFSREADR